MDVTRLVRPHELLLLAAGACVPLSIAFAPRPSATHETTIIRELVPVACDESVPVEPEKAQPQEAEPDEAEPDEAEPDEISDFMWVIRPTSRGTTPVVVLGTEPEEAWAAGPPEALEEDGIVTRPVDESALPPVMRELVGRRLDLYSSRGRACTAQVGAPRLIAEATGDLDLLLYRDPDSDDHDYWDLSERERRIAAAPAVWEGGRQLLVAPLAAPPECGNPNDLLWARTNDSKEVRPLEPSPGGRPRGALARKFLAQPELAELGEAVAYHLSLDRAPPLRDQLMARRWRADREVSVVTIATVGDDFSFEGCGFGVYPEWGMASVDADGKPGPVHVGPHGEVVSVLDLDGDGVYEVILEQPV
jgi:hypothetical protein